MQGSPQRLAILSLALLAACPAPEGCLGGGDDCIVPSPCPEVAFTCDAGTTELRLITDPSEVPGGLAALGAPGDVLIGNDKVVAVIEALDHPHYLGPSGGNLVDLGTRGGNDDVTRQIAHATGLLPSDLAHYTDLQLIDDGDVKAVQVTGTLDGRPDVRIATRYEVRPCEPGIRVRTELIHEGVDPMAVVLADGFYFGDRGSLPFTPAPDAGFSHPSFGLTTVGDVYVDTPYMVAGAHDGGASFGTVACDREAVSGFHSDIISLAGTPRRVLLPRDAEVYERFLMVAQGPSVSGAADIALEVRKQLWGEDWVEVSGRVVQEAGDKGQLGAPIRAQVTLLGAAAPTGKGKGKDVQPTIPWTHVVPAADGTWTARLPAHLTSYTWQVEAFGQRVGEGKADVDSTVEIPVPAVGELVLDATLDGADAPLLVFVEPTTDTQRDDQLASFLGHFDACAPLLGHPHGRSPGCNRALVDGTTSLVVPPGEYELFAIGGPFTTLARTTVTVSAGGSTAASLAVETLPLQPLGTLSGDFHVHGAPSFDSSFGGDDRVRAWLASGVQVIASTEHDVVGSYVDQLDALGADGKLVVIEGTESTGHILFPLFPESSFPRVIGHFNVWPVPFDPAGWLRGAPWDELAEPGTLLDRMVAQGWDDTTGVAQLNHPYGGFQFGRDFGWVDALDMSGKTPLPKAYDGSGPSLFLRTPPGATHANSDYHVQEVMNGSANSVYQPYRAIWFYLLNQGVLRGGTANSDSHTLTENVVGLPLTLVWTDTTVAGFDVDAFDLAVREGRMVGTNGPVIEATLDGAGPSLAVRQADDAATLKVRVSAAPWVPVDEVRVVVNGEVVKVLRDELTRPVSDTDTDGLLRLDTTLVLGDLLPASGDAWIVVEAGAALVDSADLDCNGWPDTSDNDGSGRIDWQDVDTLAEDPDAECLEEVGPLADPPLPARDEPGYAYRIVVPKGAPSAFTNPFVIDRDGDGVFGGAR